MVYSTRRFVLSLTLCYFVLVVSSSFSIAITSLGEERANRNAFRMFVRFVACCLFPLPLRVWDGLGLWLWHFLDFSITFLERSVGKLLSVCTAPNYKVRNICSVSASSRSSTSSVKHRIETHNNQNYWDETKQRVQWQSEARTQENHKQDHYEPDHRHCLSGTDHLIRTEEGVII